MKMRFIWLLTVILIATLALAACGTGDGNGDGAGEPGAAETPGDLPGTGDGEGEGEADGQQLIAAGEQVYTANCVTCHQQNGEGQPPTFPALAGDPFVTSEDPTQVIEVVLHGREGMPPFESTLSDEQIAQVISFIRNSWGNQASPVMPDQVSEVR